MLRTRSMVSLLALVATLLAALGAVLAYRHATPEPRFDPDYLAEYYRIRRVRPGTPVNGAAVQEAIERATGYLRRANRADGQFDYLVNLDPEVTVTRDYNLLRHAGAIYSLGMAYQREPDPATLDVMQRAAVFMAGCCFTSFEDPPMIGIWEPADVTGQAGPPRYKLGGAGLGLIALTMLERSRPDSVPHRDLVGLGNFGRFMLPHDGQFYAVYVPSAGGREGAGRSLYYPGEMALGWLMLYEFDSDPKWIDSAVEALSFLARERAIEGTAPPDHWALLATARLFELADRDALQIPVDLLLDHALQICDAILDEAPLSHRMDVMKGSLVANGVVTPTATRLEGLLAAARFLPSGHPITPHVAAAIHGGIDFLVRAQVRGGPFDGALPKAITRLPGRADDRARRFNDAATEVRIDYVQHSLSALVQYLDWQESAP